MGYNYASGNHLIACYRKDCYATVCLAPKDYKELLRTHATFVCPAGHEQHFADKTEEQKRIEELERRLSRALGAVSDKDAMVYDLAADLRECPVCGHRVRAHPWRYEPYYIGQAIERIRAEMREHLAEAHACEIPEKATVHA